MRIAVVAAGYSPGEAEQLRRSLGSWGNEGKLEDHRQRLLAGMKANGFAEEYAKRIIKQIEGFAAYGFPESHAASFAIITYVSCYLKRFYPAAFTAGLLNSQPMGFYLPASLVGDARCHGVEVRPLCINTSNTDCTLEGNGECLPAPIDAPPDRWASVGPALRLGLRLVVGLGTEVADRLAAERKERGAFADFDNVVRRMGRLGMGRRTTYSALSKLAAADAFACFGLSRREALWRVAALGADVPDLFRELDVSERDVLLPPLTAMESAVADYHTKQLTLGDHPIGLIRAELTEEDISQSVELLEADHGTEVSVAGLVLNRQRPGTAKGIVFMTLEDETGTSNVIVHPEVFREFRAVAMGSNRLIVDGTVERRSGVIHVVAKSFRSLMDGVDLVARSRDFH
jgi:error-prone DNA polymerase